MALTITDLDLTQRADQAAPLSAVQHDANLTALENKINELIDTLHALLSYAEAFLSGGVAALNLAIADTWYGIPGLTGGHQDRITFDATKNSLVVAADGDYYVSASVSFSGTTGHTFKLGFGVGDGDTQVVDTDHVAIRKAASGDVGTMSCVAIVEATAGQHITVNLLDVGGTGNVTPAEVTLVVQRKE